MKKIEVKESTMPRVDPKEVAEALGAELVGRVPAGSQITHFGLQSALYHLLRSRGGRRSLEGAGDRKKVPLLEEDWERLVRLADEWCASPAQIAAVMVHEVLEELDGYRHRFSGWPGAICLKCGRPDPMEEALADGVYDPVTNEWTDERRKEEALQACVCAVSDVDHHFDPNEELVCMHCGKKVYVRKLVCSKECYEAEFGKDD